MYTMEETRQLRAIRRDFQVSIINILKGIQEVIASTGMQGGEESYKQGLEINNISMP